MSQFLNFHNALILRVLWRTRELPIGRGRRGPGACVRPSTDAVPSGTSTWRNQTSGQDFNTASPNEREVYPLANCWASYCCLAAEIAKADIAWVTTRVLLPSDHLT